MKKHIFMCIFLFAQEKLSNDDVGAARDTLYFRRDMAGSWISKPAISLRKSWEELPNNESHGLDIQTKKETDRRKKQFSDDYGAQGPLNS